MAKFEKKNPVVEAWRTKGNRAIQTADGPRTAQPGQWIVVVGDGIYEILDDIDFREKYDAKDSDAKKALSAELKTADEQAAEDKAKAEADNQAVVDEQGKNEAKEKAAKAKAEKKKSAG
jgi:hypothetical protein